MRIPFLLPFIALLAGCSSIVPEPTGANRWADERLWPVLEAQEHRDTEGLCALLKNGSSIVREAAALAFASVQDSASVPCLLAALADSASEVRARAVFALGFVADSATVQTMAERAMDERNADVQRAYMRASFLAMQRNGMLKDPKALLYYLDQADAHEQARAADAMRRLPDSSVLKLREELPRLLNAPIEEVRAFALLGMRKLGPLADTLLLERTARDGSRSLPERICAMRSWARTTTRVGEPLLTDLLLDPHPIIARTALEELRTLPCPMPSEALRSLMGRTSGVPLSLAIEGLTMRCGQDLHEHFTSARVGLSAEDGPYAAAELWEVMVKPTAVYLPEAMQRLAGTEHPAIKQSVFQWAVRCIRENMMRSRFATREAQYAQLRDLVRSVIATGDAGLISAVAELLMEEDGGTIQLLFPKADEAAAFAPLLPVRDLEARLLLQQVIAKRDGANAPEHQRPVFNHPIDKARLRALEQGQQYRIITSKGDVIIATDVNECPGSSLAFDSLVAAGYYNGKAFHRMVPNFVVQGGCPRGDGYGGMPWTLRTEIGSKPFTAGSVGLASAGPDTESCQFFITHSAAPHLDGRYTRFGEVVSGMDVVWRLQVGDVIQRVERIRQ